MQAFAALIFSVLFATLSFAAHRDTIALCYKELGDASRSIPLYDRSTEKNKYTINTGDCPPGYKPASGTLYESWPNAGSKECKEYNGCVWAGQFSQVNAGSLPSCRPPAKPLLPPGLGAKMCRFPKRVVRRWKVAATWEKRPDLLRKKLHVRLSTREGAKEIGIFNVVDTCSDNDCAGCCSSNTSGGKYPLIDMEIMAYCKKSKCDANSHPHPPNHRPA